MIARMHRFHGHASLRAVYKHGLLVRGSLFSVKHAARKGDKPYRIAVVVSRKVSKSAVVRNRIRRRLYEAVRTSTEALPSGTDIVITVFSVQLATMDSSQLQSQVADAISRSRAQRNE